MGEDQITKTIASIFEIRDAKCSSKFIIKGRNYVRLDVLRQLLEPCLHLVRVEFFDDFEYCLRVLAAAATRNLRAEALARLLDQFLEQSSCIGLVICCWADPAGRCTRTLQLGTCLLSFRRARVCRCRFGLCFSRRDSRCL